jgi:hypothetical protein
MPERKHHIYTYLRTGKINPSIRGFRKLQRYLEDIEKELIDDLGGQERVSAGQEILIKATVEAYGVIILSSMYCKKEGILRPDMAEKGVIELQPVLGKQFLAFMNTIRQNLLALNLTEGQAKEKLDYEKYVEETYGKKGKGNANQE